MPDPVAWTMVEPGWDVVDAHGEKVGTVEQVVGAPDLDIFDGFSVRKGVDVLSRPKYVPAEQIGAIEEGTVHLTIASDAFAELGDYVPPRTA
jgi:uncharacterized protein YrrD